MAHIVLLGDSIFDNRVYVGPGPDVITQLREKLPHDWQATLKAVDGSVVEDVGRQALESPPDATHFVISAGGNNALMNADILGMSANSAAEVFSVLADRASDFELQYREMLKIVSSRNLSTDVCTIYFPNFSEPTIQKIATATLSSFNDVILRQAAVAGLPVLDLRLICSEKSDYANEIEPSSRGGEKIAAKILEVAGNHDFSNKRTSIYF
ncbi:MAG TPA: SGNH/GDSL hydrolase family protein [Pyrinomonadaceae bacterium]|jgi:hypothetical protein